MVVPMPGSPGAQIWTAISRATGAVLCDPSVAIPDGGTANAIVVAVRAKAARLDFREAFFDADIPFEPSAWAPPSPEPQHWQPIT